MGIKFNCPNGHKLNVKSFLAGRRGICPHCDARFRIPLESGGVVELVVKGDRDEATQLTDAMQEDPAVADDAAAGVTAAAVAQPAFGSPLGSSASANHIVSSSTVAKPMTGDPMASVDPLGEDPQAVWYVRPRSGGQYGPAVGETLREWIGEGRVAGDSLVWREGWADWRQASSVFPQLAGLLSSPGPAFPASSPAPAVGSLPVASIGSTSSIASAIPGGKTVPVLGTSPANPVGSSLRNAGEIRRRSGNFTAIIVMLLVVLAIVLVGVFAWVMVSQPKPETASRPASLQPV